MSPAQVRSVALFFYLTLLDEELSERASIEAVHRIRKKSNSGESLVPIIVHEIFRVWGEVRGSNLSPKVTIGPKARFVPPMGVSMGAWRQFHKEAGHEDLISVVLSVILQIPEQDIAIGLGVSVGTVRYRAGRGLRQLGGLLTLGEMIG